MREPSTEEAARRLELAAAAEARGRATVRRPPWYPIGLGVCTALALAGFAVPGMATAGVVLGGVVGPVALEAEARRRTGGSPAKTYLEPPTRKIAVSAALVGVAIAAASLVALKVTDASWVVLPGAVVIGIGTFVVARRVDRLRAARSDRQASRP